jgi:ribose 1,5-bisphosphokinase
MAGKLIYVVGPSGAGKDALLDYALARRPAGLDVRFARRWITRPADAGGEHHRPLTLAGFEDRVRAGAFALYWRAHGNGYGIDREILDWLRAGATVVVSGSREHLPQALRDFPELQVIHVTVDPAVLRERLLRRGRETAEQVDERLARAGQYALPAGAHVTEVRNDRSLAEGEAGMLAAIVRIARGE